MHYCRIYLRSFINRPPFVVLQHPGFRRGLHLLHSPLKLPNLYMGEFSLLSFSNLFEQANIITTLLESKVNLWFIH